VSGGERRLTAAEPNRTRVWFQRWSGLMEVQIWQHFGKAFGIVEVRWSGLWRYSFGSVLARRLALCRCSLEWLMEVRFWQRFGKTFGVVQVRFGVVYGGEVVRVVVECFQGKKGAL